MTGSGRPPRSRRSGSSTTRSAGWRGLVVDGDALRVGDRGRISGAGLDVLTPGGTVRLPWDGWATRWTAEGIQGSRSGPPRVEVRRGGGFEHRNGEQWVLRGRRLTLLGLPFAEVEALLGYLGTTPPARAVGLRADRLARLLEELRADTRRGARYPPGPGVLGDKLDLSLTIERVLAARWPRRYRGRPVRGEPAPTVDALVPDVRAALPRWTTDRIGDGDIRARLDRYLAVDPWPFDVLVTPASPGSPP